MGRNEITKYDPEAWEDLFKRAGAQDAVLTTKPHNGVALWDADARDLIAPMGKNLGCALDRTSRC